MGVLTLQLLACGQLILYSLVFNNMIDAQHTGESSSSLSASKAPPLNAAGNHTENVSNSSSYLAQRNSTATQNNVTTQTTTIVSNTTLGPNQSNVTGLTGQPNTTENAQTTQSATSSAFNISSTAVTSTDNTTVVTKPTAITSTTVTQNSFTSLNKSQAGDGLNHSEKSLTILFSILLGVIVLVVLGHFVYKFIRSKESSIQYTHRRLHNEDAGEPFAVPDDTLVISGGLYDGPQIYNPTMTVQNEEFQIGTPGFSSRPTQFRLEFLREDQDRADPDTSSFQTFHAHDQES